jgi:hypothetical protein
VTILKKDSLKKADSLRARSSKVNVERRCSTKSQERMHFSKSRNTHCQVPPFSHVR